MNKTKATVVLVAAACLLAPGCGGGKKKHLETNPKEAAASEPAAPRHDAEPASRSEVFDNPEFRREFLGSYGFQAEVEPKVTAEEKTQLEEVLPLLASDPDAAADRLAEMTTPESSALFDFLLANVRVEQGRLDDAERGYRSALLKFPSFRRAHKNLGLIYARTGRPKDAIEHLSRVVELGGADGMTYGLLGWAYTATEQYVSAESAYRDALMLQPGLMDWKLGLLQSLHKQEKFAEAVALCDELLQANPDRHDLWLLQANAYLGMGRNLDAARNFELVARMGKATPETEFTLGDIYVNEQMWDLAARAYRKAVELDSSQDPSRAVRSATQLAQRGALEQAKSVLDTIDATLGDSLGADDKKQTLKLASRIAVAEGQGGEAVDALEQIVALDPLDGDALILLGEHYARSSEVDRAQLYYERASNLADFEADAKVHLGQLLVGEGNYDDAIPLLKRAQELDPRDDLQRYIEQVERSSRRNR